MSENDSADRFGNFLKRLVGVPKHEIDEQEREYQESRKTEEPAKPGQIVTTPSDSRPH